MSGLSEHRGVWVFSENKELLLELLGQGSELAKNLQTDVTAVALGSGVGSQANELVAHGANKVYVVDHPILEKIHADPYVSALFTLVNKYKPEILLIGSTRRGKEVGSRLAAKLEIGCVSDCSELEIDDNGQLLMRRVVYGGNAIATETCLTTPQMATVPPRTFEKLEPKERTGEVVNVDVKVEEPRTEIIETKEIEAATVKLEEAKVIIACGRGVEKKEDIKMFEELADTLSGQVGYTRPLCEDRRWYTEWIGLSGHYVKPALYIAAGISGVIQHIAGIRDSQIIVAINKDAEAPIFEIADYKIVGDIYQVVPALSAALKKLQT